MNKRVGSGDLGFPRARCRIGLGTRGYRATRRGRTLSGTGEASSASACTGWSPLLSSLTSSIPAASFFFPRPVAGFAASGSLKAGASVFFSARPAFAAAAAVRGTASALPPSSGLVAGEFFFSPPGFSMASAPDLRTGPRFGITPRNAALPRFHARKGGMSLPGRRPSPAVATRRGMCAGVERFARYTDRRANASPDVKARARLRCGPGCRAACKQRAQSSVFFPRCSPAQDP